MEMYQRLVAYKLEHNNTIVPYIYDLDSQLEYWVDRQRQRNKKKTIAKEQARLLNSIGFVWVAGKRYARTQSPSSSAAVAIRRSKRGDSNNKVLQNDNSEKRTARKESQSSSAETRSPTETNEPPRPTWLEMYRQYIAVYPNNTYSDERGSNSTVSAPAVAAEELEDWVAEQCRAHKNQEMVEERMYLLNSIEFDWSKRDDDISDSTAEQEVVFV